MSSIDMPRSIELKALDLRIQGWSYREIAEELHLVDAQKAFQMVDRASHLYLVAGDKFFERQLDIERLDGLYKFYFKLAGEGDFQAARLVLQIAARRSRIFGYDNININISQFEDRLRQLAQQNQLDPELAVAEATHILQQFQNKPQQ